MINYLLNETDYEIVSTYFMESTFKEENNRVEFVKLDKENKKMWKIY